jgi:signal transduction histidine kinase
MKGEIHVTAEMDATSVRLVVADNGQGIPAENIGRVFDPFFTTRMGQGGSGLGLNIVFNIVRTTLGGTIRVESRRDVRTTFTINIPRIAPGLAAVVQTA